MNYSPFSRCLGPSGLVLLQARRSTAAPDKVRRRSRRQWRKRRGQRRHESCVCTRGSSNQGAGDPFGDLCSKNQWEPEPSRGPFDVCFLFGVGFDLIHLMSSALCL